jgi:DNA polymerase epsilon subunit 3
LSSIARIVKAVLPESMQLAKDARTAFARSASIFALYVTAAANDLCRDAKRATITAQDVYKALDELEFETLTPQVKEFVEMFRATQAAKKGSVGGEGAGGEEADEVTDDEQGARRRGNRQRRVSRTCEDIANAPGMRVTGCRSYHDIIVTL